MGTKTVNFTKIKLRGVELHLNDEKKLLIYAEYSLVDDQSEEWRPKRIILKAEDHFTKGQIEKMKKVSQMVGSKIKSMEKM